MDIKEELEKELESTKCFTNLSKYDLGTTSITVDSKLLEDIKPECLTKEQLKTGEYVKKIFKLD